MKYCPKCNTEHSKQGTFCSRQCANSRGPRSADTKEKQRLKTNAFLSTLSDAEMDAKIAKLHAGNPNFACGPYTKIRLQKCTHCNNEFWSNNEHTVEYNTTCSDECFLGVKRKNRSGSKVIYKNELYDSHWEVEIAQWLDEHNIIFTRPAAHIPWVDSVGKKRKYFPDFYLPSLDLYLDPKNKFCIKSQQEKLDYVQNIINLVYGEVLHIKTYIENKLK
jgi:predicted nucleic acid-binding Zn ribbon protein